MNNLSKAQVQKLQDFLGESISPKEFATSTRRLLLETIKLVLSSPDDVTFDKNWIANGHFWLTELCEILDPQLN